MIGHVFHGTPLLSSLQLLITIIFGSAEDADTSDQRLSRCTRHRCIEHTKETCLEEQSGMFRSERGCTEGKVCTQCSHDQSSVTCRCENKPYSTPVQYNQACSPGRDCVAGEGICFRPCATYFHRADCLATHCAWNAQSSKCQDIAPASASATIHAGRALSRLRWETQQDSHGRRLEDSANDSEEQSICAALSPPQYYCSFDKSCVLDCQRCGWKSTEDLVRAICVRPSASACKASACQVYCASDSTCHPQGDCSRCTDRPVVDYSQNACLAPWWDSVPLNQPAQWVCRWRNKVGMQCIHDQDCIYGLRQCLRGRCAPLQPYNESHACSSDYDCPHVGYYCPADPTDGADPYWVQVCRRQKSEGMTCLADRECEPGTRCNSGEPRPRCRKLFSLDVGVPADDDALCTFAWRSIDGKCATKSRSKRAGRPCSEDFDCTTTDASGRVGSCVCKTWWNETGASYCMPVPGDYANHQESLRNLLDFKESKCGSFWTEAECLRTWETTFRTLKLQLDCETQKLSGGPYVPPTECHLQHDQRFADHCALLQVERERSRAGHVQTASRAWTRSHCKGPIGCVLLVWSILWTISSSRCVW
eukprot:TRINITY_DN20977_c0_g6_i1.p1 TRINITY_DN20977_c0_g6~~TRINITY_DN20977_c0_g6_i1.p1  ORF type:complete len:592 (-),score=23.80 TRINITY_DN20977_c0_g6_i1:153-1928(-)